jgi:hypothetical protein
MYSASLSHPWRWMEFSGRHSPSALPARKLLHRTLIRRLRRLSASGLDVSEERQIACHRWGIQTGIIGT